jgi:prolipoprotein diacylglyceryl transferase
MLLNYITWNVDPVLFSIGSLSVRWYGLLWALGFLIGYFIMKRIYKREGMAEDSLDKLLIYMLVSTVVGARLGHCLFYEPVDYLSHPWNILKIWEGGLASHGGAIGILIGLWLYVRSYNKSTKKQKTDLQRINYIWILDRIVVVVCLVGALIRCGNVMNHEIYGTPTSMPWGFVFLRGSEQFAGTFDNPIPFMYCYSCEMDPQYSYTPPFPQDQWLPCHPTGLYEAFFCLVAMGILLWMYYKRDLGTRQPGLMFGTFLVIIFGSRIGIEFLKNVQVVEEIEMRKNAIFDIGQWLSIPFVLVGIGMIVWSFMNRKKTESQA